MNTIKGTVRWYGSHLCAANITSSQQNNDDELQNKCLARIKIKMMCSCDLEPRQPFPPKTVMFMSAYYTYKGICCNTLPSRGSLRDCSPKVDEVSRASCICKSTCHRIQMCLCYFTLLCVSMVFQLGRMHMTCNTNSHLYTKTVKPCKPLVLLLFHWQ